MKSIYLVACVSKKTHGPISAKDLYQSDWFRKARAFVETQGDPWYILSAKYGLLPPNRKIHRYEKTLNEMSTMARRKWSAEVLADLKKVVRPKDKAVILAGQRYREFLVDGLRKHGAQVDVPMEGLTIGLQLRWLKRHIGG